MAVDTQKFLALPPAKTGENLAPNLKPKTSSERHGIGGSFLSIKVKIVKAADILKGTLAVKKIEEKKKKQRDQLLKRKKKEEELEKPPGDDDKDAKKLKLKLPAFSWLDTVKNFVFNVLFGWAALKFLEFLPKMIGLLKPLASIAGFFIKFGEFILKTFITFVDWGYKAYDWTRGAIKNLFGEGGAAAFDKFSGVLKTLINLQLTLTLAMIALSDSFGSNIFEMVTALRHIFKYGLRRAGRRALIQIFGKKTAGSLLGKSIATKTVAATTAGGVTGGTSGIAGTVGGVSTGAAAAVVAGAGLLSAGIGEGIGQVNKWGYNIEKEWRQKADSKGWWNPMKYWWGISAGIMGILNRLFSFLGGIFDIIGAPFRMIIELIRFPFLNKRQKEQQRDNLVKYDTRIREQFRRAFNAIDVFGLINDNEGSWGTIYGPAAGKKASKEMFNKDDTDDTDDKSKSINPLIESLSNENNNKINTKDLEKSASYENNNGTTVVMGSSSGSGNGNNQSTESTGSFTITSSNGSGDSTLSDLQYKNSG